MEQYLIDVLKLIHQHDYVELAAWIEKNGGYSVEHIADQHHVLALIYHVSEIALAKAEAFREAGDG